MTQSLPARRSSYLHMVMVGQFNMRGVEIYKQCIGQQNFEMGTGVSVVLLIPAIFAFTVDRFVQKRQVASLSARSVPYQPKPSRRFDVLALGYCVLVAIFILGLLGICQFAALVKFWPYDLSLSLTNYRSEEHTSELQSLMSISYAVFCLKKKK